MTLMHAGEGSRGRGTPSWGGGGGSPRGRIAGLRGGPRIHVVDVLDAVDAIEGFLMEVERVQRACEIVSPAQPDQHDEHLRVRVRVRGEGQC